MLVSKSSNTWCECEITLTNDKESECLIIKYVKSNKEKEMKLPVLDITCMARVFNQTYSNCFTIHTAVRTMERNYILLSAPNEKEMNEWMTSLSSSSQRARMCEGAPKPSALWCTSAAGDVFFSDSKDDSDFTNHPVYHLYWRQVGGHLLKVEAGVDQVVWGLGYDGRPWCFTRGFGGGIFPASMSSAEGIYDQSDEKVFYTYENQRWYPVDGYGVRRLPTDRYEWSDETGILERRQEGYPLPNSDWQWSGEWKVDFNTKEGTDKWGWMYALDFPREYSCEKHWNDCVRRRRWQRSARVNTTGPWLEVQPSVQLKDISIQIDHMYQDDGSISVWAVSHDGDLLCRKGVTSDRPQGESWCHITTPIQFSSVSVGCNNIVWGIGNDGAAYLRIGYEGSDDRGKMWDRFPAPGLNPLVLISVGRNTVWAMDKYGEHYYREGVTETFPEGTKWLKIFGRVQSVSVSANDEVWVKSQGGLEKCFNTSQETPTGRGWVLALPSFWGGISARANRGNLINKEKGLLDKAESVIDEPDSKLSSGPSEDLKRKTYKDLMESGDIYNVFGADDDFIPSSDEES